MKVCKQTFHISHLRIWEINNVKFSTYYFHMKTKILADFQICISVPLSHSITVFGSSFNLLEMASKSCP